jgi:hypothetical protein
MTRRSSGFSGWIRMQRLPTKRSVGGQSVVIGALGSPKCEHQPNGRRLGPTRTCQICQLGPPLGCTFPHIHRLPMSINAANTLLLTHCHN